MASYRAIFHPVLNAAQRHAEFSGDRNLRHLPFERNDLDLLGWRQSAARAVRIPQGIPVLGAIELIFRVRLPFQMARVDAAIVTFPAIVRGLVLWCWWCAVGHLAHEAVRPIVLAIVPHLATPNAPIP